MKRVIASLLAIVPLYGAAQAAMPIYDTRSLLEDHVYYLASEQMLGRDAGSPESRKAAEYIAGQFREIGLYPAGEDHDDGSRSYIQNFSRYNKQYANVVGFIPGNDPILRDEYIVIGAHYDHIGYRIATNRRDTVVYAGADDNASGTAVLIEAARLLKKREGELARTVIIAAFDAEEDGLYGSQAMAENMDIDKVKFMASIDMVGWLETSGKLEIQNTATLHNGQAIIDGIPVPPGLDIRIVKSNGSIFTGSDHDSFARHSIPSVLLTTGTESPYHKPEDTPEKIDYDGLCLITDYVMEMALHMASLHDIRYHHPMRTVEVGITASIGSSHIFYPNSAVKGRSRISFNAGIAMQFNINERFAIRPEVLYSHRTFRFPTATDGAPVIDNSHGKLVMPSLTVPVNFMWKLPIQDGAYIYLGAGAYYSHTFNAEIDGVAARFNRSEGGISLTAGCRMSHVGLGYTGYIPLSRVASSPLRMLAYSNYLSVYYMF